MTTFSVIFSKAKPLLLLFGFLFCAENACATPPDSTSGKKFSGHLDRLSKDWLYVGVEFAQPMLRYGYKADGPWFGPNLLLFGGFMQLNALRGTASVTDSGKVYQQLGSIIQMGFNVPIPLLYKRTFEVVPSLGFGFNIQNLEDLRRRGQEIEYDANQFGMYFRPGLQVKIGPIIGTIGYNVGIAYNFTKRNAIPSFTHFPTVGIHLSSMPILMNPKDFSASGKRHYKDLVDVRTENSGITYYKKISEDQNYIKYRKEEIKWVKSTYNHRYEEEVINVNDVHPFTYIGPRISSTYFIGGEMEYANNVGLNLGFRYGLWWVNAFGEVGDVFVKSSVKLPTVSANFSSASYPVTSGKYGNSMKYGGQAGIDLVVRAIKSDFKAHSGQEKEARAATSFFAIIPYVGYGQAELGAFSYHRKLTPNEIEEYETRTKKKVFDYASVGKVSQFFNFGIGIHIGALTFGMDYYFYRNNDHLQSRQIYAGLNLPIARIVRSVAVRGYLKKISQQPD